MISEITYKVDVNSLRKNEEDKEFNMNDIGRIKFELPSPSFTIPTGVTATQVVLF